MKSGAFRRNLIRSLNDTFRQTLQGGRVMMTSGIASLPGCYVNAIMTKVQLFDAFNKANDPHREHDFGSFEHGAKRICFKIDYYDAMMESGSEDPADPERTTRVLTVMLACER